MRRKMPPRIAQGQAGVYTVAAQLILRSINPSFPAIDRGADIITDWGTRIQVKSGFLRRGAYGGSYHFCLDSGQTLYTSGQGYKKSARTHSRKFSDECDFFVMWGIEGNRFWIIPAVVLDYKTTVVMVGADTPLLRADLDAIRKDRANGMTFKEIEQKHKVGQRIIYSALKGDGYNTERRYAMCRELLSYENCWNLLIANEQLLSQGESEYNTTSACAEEVGV
jgi:hypothetical protein